MNHKVYPIIVLGLALGAIFASCKPTTINKKNPDALASANGTNGQCMSAAETAAAASSAIGNLTAPQLALADMDVDGRAVGVRSQYTSRKTPASVINIDYALLGNSDYSATFVLWKACTVDGKQCSNNGKYKKTYHFNISNIANLPTGILNVSVKLCVDDKKFLVASDRNKAVNACTNASPCYCGKETKIKYANNLTATGADPKFASAVANLESAQEQLLTLAQTYIDQAQSYANSCKVADNKKVQLQYANNIAAMSSAELAGLIESYAGYLKATVDAQTQGGSLNLADASCSVGGGMPSTGYSMGTGFSMGTGLAMGTSTTSYPSNTGTTVLTPNNGNATDTNVIVTNASPSSTSTKGSGSPAMLGVGIVTMVVGVAMLVNYGVKFKSTSNQSLVDKIMEGKLFNRKVLFVDDVGNREETSRRNQQGEREIEEAARTSGASIESVGRTPLQESVLENVRGSWEAYVGVFDPVDLSGFHSSFQNAFNKQYFIINDLYKKIEAHLAMGLPVDDLVSQLDAEIKKMNNLVDGVDKAVKEPRNAVPADNPLHANVANMKKFCAVDAPASVSRLKEYVADSSISRVASSAPGHDPTNPVASNRPTSNAPEGVAAKPKTSIFDSAKGGLIAGAVVAAIGALATYGGAGLAAGSCGNFQATVKDMETKLYNQYLQVKIAILQVQAAASK